MVDHRLRVPFFNSLTALRRSASLSNPYTEENFDPIHLRHEKREVDAGSRNGIRRLEADTGFVGTLDQELGIPAGARPAAWAAAVAFLPEMGNNSTAPLVSSPGYRYAITTCRSASVSASGPSTWASLPGWLSIWQRRASLAPHVR